MRPAFALALFVIVALVPLDADAQVPRQWISVSFDSLRTLPPHFKEHPIEDLIGRPMAEAQRETYEYRSRDWGLGSHAFVAGGIGRLSSDLGRGSRYFGDGGGGLNVGPIGVQLAIKLAWNQLDAPVSHAFFTVPVALRGTVSF